MKRNTKLRLTTIGLLTVSAFALMGCQDEDSEAISFRNVQECIGSSKTPDSKFTSSDCETGYKLALDENIKSAPKYDEKLLCEEEHGAQNCVEQHSSGGSSFFTPLMMGYMMGSWSNGQNSYKHNTVPVYPVAGGGYASSTGYYTKTLNTKAYESGRILSIKPVSTSKFAPMTHTTVASRGGFGGSRIVTVGG